MATISAKDVAALRAKTGIGMMECKKALVEAEGDAEKAIKILRERGLAVAAKKQDRIAADGIVDILTVGMKTAMIEVNTETDFVAKNESFKAFVKDLLKTIIENGVNTVEELAAAKFVGTDMTVEAKLQEMIFTIGEKISIRRFTTIEGHVGTYIHGAGSIGCVVLVEADDATAEKAEFAEMAKNLALQVGAYPVSYVDKESVPASVIAEETEVIFNAIKNDPANAKKPENIIREKMIPGRLGKFYEANCLTEQEYLKDDNMKVSQYIASVAKALGADVKVKSFARYEKGEGIQKREDNFAEEIAKLTSK